MAMFGGGGGGPTETQISVPDELQPLFAQFTNRIPPLVGAGADVMEGLYKGGQFAAPMSPAETLYGDILNQLIQQRIYPQLSQAAQVVQPMMGTGVSAPPPTGTVMQPFPPRDGGAGGGSAQEMLMQSGMGPASGQTIFPGDRRHPTMPGEAMGGFPAVDITPNAGPSPAVQSLLDAVTIGPARGQLERPIETPGWRPPGAAVSYEALERAGAQQPPPAMPPAAPAPAGLAPDLVGLPPEIAARIQAARDENRRLYGRGGQFYGGSSEPSA